MKSIETVTGSLAAKKLGYCQMHEHLFVKHTPAADTNPALCIDDYGKSAVELNDYSSCGGSAVLDAQPIGAGRDVSTLMRLSRETGVFIITVTGFHLLKFYEKDHWIYTLAEADLVEIFLKELLEGCVDESQSGIFPFKAGAVKAAIPDEGASGRYAVLLRAAAVAAVKADVPLVLHTEAGNGAIAAIQICKTIGLSPERILVCHADRQTDNLILHQEIADTGVFLEYDTIGRPKYHDDLTERKLILHMLDKGYGDQLLLSLDTTAERLRSYGGKIGLCYLLRTFLPSMQEDGVPAEIIHKLTHDNPRKAFL